MRPNSRNAFWIVVCTFVTLFALAAPPRGAFADGEPDGLQENTGRRHVELWPPAEDGEKPRKPPSRIDLNGWEYRATKSADPRDGVPWVLIARPIGPNAERLQEGQPEWSSIPLDGDSMIRLSGATVLKREDTKDKLPIVKIPKVAWDGWMSPELRDAVGIHFHEFVTDDLARVLITIHKVPPDDPEGAPPDKKGDRKVKSGARLEATLLTPVVFSLDQSVAVRVDPLEEKRADDRAQHEFGHARASQEVLLGVLRGPQDWSPQKCIGRRSNVAYYYRRELIGRNWQGFKGGVGKLATLRTSIVLVPPTRWSILLPLPPERVTQKHIDHFNDMIVNVGGAFAQADRAAQEAYHSRYGSYE